MSFDISIITSNIPLFLHGLQLTLLVTAVALVSGAILGLLACLGSLRQSGIIFRIARGYINVFRTTPEMVLIFWVYYCLPPLIDLRLTGFTAGTIALSLVSGAFIAEIYRAGVLSIPTGQIEAANSLVIPTYYIWTRVILPQALRRMMPAFINYLCDLLKHTTLLASIGVYELAFSAYSLGARTFHYIESLSTIAIVFFVIVYPISTYSQHAEKRLRQRTNF